MKDSFVKQPFGIVRPLFTIEEAVRELRCSVSEIESALDAEEIEHVVYADQRLVTEDGLRVFFANRFHRRVCQTPLLSIAHHSNVTRNDTSHVVITMTDECEESLQKNTTSPKLRMPGQRASKPDDKSWKPTRRRK